MTTETTTYYLVYADEQAPPDKPRGLYRRVFSDGRIIASEADHPRLGWHQTDYWLRLQFKGEGDKHLVEVDEQRALQTQAAVLAQYRGTHTGAESSDGAGPPGSF